MTPLQPRGDCTSSTLALRRAAMASETSNQSGCRCCSPHPCKPGERELQVEIPTDVERDYSSDTATLSPSSPPSLDGESFTPSPLSVDPPREYLNERLEQSPIDIRDMESHPELLVPGSIRVSHSSTEAEIVHLGSNFEVRWKSKDRNTLTIDGKVFYAVQFHFHTPSEHTINGKVEAMEFHMVHQADDGNLAVVALFFCEGAENEFLKQFWHELPGMDPTMHNRVAVGSIDPRHLDLLSGLYFRYRGSLTTPPYSEGVEWLVVRDVAEASRAQIHTFMDVLPRANARAVQPLNKRRVSVTH